MQGYIESYDDVTTYVMDGANPGEYAVYIAYAMKFIGIDTKAPGLVPAYVRPDEAGQLRLLRYEDFDDNVRNFMGTVSQTNEVSELAAAVNNAYAAALESDTNLKAFIDNLSGNTTAQSPEESQAAAESEAATQAAEGEISFTEVDDIQYATTQVKCRKVPNLDSETTDYTLVTEGTRVHVVGDSAEWAHVFLEDGTEGYIYKQYLTPDKP